MGLFPLLLLLLSHSLLISLSSGEISPELGICYGQLGNNLPSPSESVQLLKTLKPKAVKLYDANPQILNALRGQNLQVSIMVPNQILPDISKNQTLADRWVRINVSPFYPRVRIRYLLVGNEVLSSWNDNATQHSLVPAMRRIHRSITSQKLKKIKVGTPLAMDVIAFESPLRPSNATFRADLSDPVIKPLLEFLNRTRSFFFLDVYPFFQWASDPVNVGLEYALLKAENINKYADPGTGLVYGNLLDQMLDSVIFAMRKLGYPDLRLFIAETGWPNAGDIDQIGANIYNAASYNRNVIKKLTAKPPVGTPARPGKVIPAFIFALYNENQKGGQSTERHFGLMYPNGSNVYPIDLAGRTPESKYKSLPLPTNDEPHKGKIWCVVAEGGDSNLKALRSEMAFACGQGNGTCDPIRPGGKCFKPVSLVGHASYAFNSNWAQFRKLGGFCFFNGLAVQTTKDPSYGSCKFPSITLNSAGKQVKAERTDED
ncbi:probable glucan endo-1,3-beta-glucosidase A6 [Rhododendron vialii]|uniref:probable glucan endo-1,3-beta-glucosidase A6 n=1 Tax=Rhododendron vialii TaxID=182163 RepID=UPI00265D923B|nr:probable glucan endo-1,3-beta-glucosidase A6 [Rhododendron vialii]